MDAPLLSLLSTPLHLIKDEKTMRDMILKLREMRTVPQSAKAALNAEGAELVKKLPGAKAGGAVRTPTKKSINLDDLGF